MANGFSDFQVFPTGPAVNTLFEYKVVHVTISLFYIRVEHNGSKSQDSNNKLSANSKLGFGTKITNRIILGWLHILCSMPASAGTKVLHSLLGEDAGEPSKDPNKPVGEPCSYLPIHCTSAA